MVGLSIVRPNAMPPLPPEARGEMGWKLISRVLWGMIPSVVLIFLVLGTIFMGLATPTEAGAMGAVGAIVLAALHRRLTWPLVRQGMQSTMRITAMVVFILVGSTCFSLVFQGMDGGRWIEHMLTGLPGGQLGFLVFVNIFVFFLAFFLDFFEIAFIVIPLLAPVAAKLGIDLIWFGVLLCVNMQTSFMHPPFGFALFLSSRHRPEGGEELRHLLGRDPLGRDAAHPRRHRDLLAGVGDLLDRRAEEPRSGRHRAEAAAAPAPRHGPARRPPGLRPGPAAEDRVRAFALRPLLPAAPLLGQALS